MKAAEQYLGNYRLVRLVGEGRSGEVYLGEHVLLTRPAAIKVIHARFSTQEIARFFQEAKAISRLEHPHIVRLYDCDVAEGRPFLVMEYAQGGTLREKHPGDMPLNLLTIQEYLQQLATALAYAHERNLIHRDVKPENVLIGSSGQLFLADFGFALLTQSASSRLPIQDLVGTVAYMAPEQLQGHPRRASDQYALGVMVYEWLTGRPLFAGSVAEIVAQHLHTAPRPPRELRPIIGKPLEAVVLRALEKDPKARFASVEAFAGAFMEACLTDAGTLWKRLWPRWHWEDVKSGQK